MSQWWQVAGILHKIMDSQCHLLILICSLLCCKWAVSGLNTGTMTNHFAFCQQSIIYFTASSPKISHWIKDESIQKTLQPYAKWHYIERDLAMFNINIDEDYVPCLQGITRASFCSVYLDWIQYCAGKRREVSVCL